MTVRRFLLAAALLAPLACRETTQPEPQALRIWGYSLQAYTFATFNPTLPDTVACYLQAHVPMADSIATPWSGTVTVYAWRARRSAGRTITADTTIGSALFTLTRGLGDSLHATLHGSVDVAFSGRKVQGDVGARGEWTCDARSVLAGSQPGEARGTWSAYPEMPD
jgi:hypothetical protein